jgi:hypothetical protein
MILLFALILTAHLLCVNLASAGPLVSIYADFLDRRACQGAAQAGRFLNRGSLQALVVGTLIGILLGLLRWDGLYSGVVQRLWYKIQFGIWEWGFSVVLLAINLRLWREKDNVGSRRRWARSLISLLAATNLLYHFPPLLYVLSDLVRRAELDGAPLGAAGFRQRMLQPFILAQTVHFWLASFAVTGVVLAVWSIRSGGGGGGEGEGEGGGGEGGGEIGSPTGDSAEWARRGGRLALTVSLAQIPVGIWLLVSTPSLTMARFLGADPASTLTFAAAVLLAMHLLHRLANLALGELHRRSIAVAAASLVIVVFLMTLGLQLAQIKGP